MESFKKISINNAEHYNWGDNCDGWHLLNNERLSVIQERMLPHTSEQRHFHHHSQQLFYLLSGEATFEINGEIIQLTANECIHIPAGSKHCISNQNNDDLHFLVVSEPRSYGDRTNL